MLESSCCLLKSVPYWTSMVLEEIVIIVAKLIK